MKYFFLVYAIIAALFIGLMPGRGDKFSSPPIRLFPDMDEQDKLLAQAPDDFFPNGVGSRHPVPGTFPVGFQAPGEREAAGIPEYEFGGGTGYYETGVIDDYYGTGMPEELGLTEDNVASFLRAGEEMFHVNCMPCHGAAGDGQGITTQFGMPGVANLLLENFGSDAYPDGRMFSVISNGKGNMGPYKHNLPLHQRWAVIAYVRALQASRSAPLSEESVQAAYQAAIEAGEVTPPAAEPAPEAEVPAVDPAPGAGDMQPRAGTPEARAPEIEEDEGPVQRVGDPTAIDPEAFIPGAENAEVPTEDESPAEERAPDAPQPQDQ